MTEPQTLFTRDDLTTGLRELITGLHATGEPVQIRIVGGAAISLAYNADRSSTVDIDAVLTPRDVVLDVAGDIAERHGWAQDWLNDAASLFVPEGYGQRAPEWVPVAVAGQVEMFVASAETLLAMKLKTCNRRGLREVNDLRILLALTAVRSLDDADELLDAFWPADALSAKGRQVVQIALDTLPADHVPPEVPTLV